MILHMKTVPTFLHVFSFKKICVQKSEDNSGNRRKPRRHPHWIEMQTASSPEPRKKSTSGWCHVWNGSW